MRVLRVALLGLVLAMALIVPAIAHAADDTLAKEHLKRGVAAARAGKWEEAREAFQASYDASPHATTLLNLASAEAQTGRLVKSAQTYRRVVGAPSTENITREQRDAASNALTQVERRIGHLKIVVRARQPNDQIDVDGTSIAGNEVAVDPGPHVVKVIRDGVDVAHARPSVAEGQTVNIALEPPTSKPTASAAPALTSTPSSETSETKPSGGVLSSPWFWTAAAVVVIGGTVTIACVTTFCNGDEPRSGNLGSVKLP